MCVKIFVNVHMEYLNPSRHLKIGHVFMFDRNIFSAPELNSRVTSQ